MQETKLKCIVTVGTTAISNLSNQKIYKRTRSNSKNQ